MQHKDQDTQKNTGDGNAFQINNGPSTKIKPSRGKKKQKPQGNALQINGSVKKTAANKSGRKR